MSKSCGELSCDECNDSFEKLQRELAVWKVVAENWRVDAVNWSRKNAELQEVIDEYMQKARRRNE